MPTFNQFRFAVTLALLPGLVMMLTFCLLANAGLVTSDPEGHHPINAAEMLMGEAR